MTTSHDVRVESRTPQAGAPALHPALLQLAHGEQGGNLIALSSAKPGHLPANRFWGGVAVTLPVLMVGTSKALCVQEVMAFMDTSDLAVEAAIAGTGIITHFEGWLRAHLDSGALEPVLEPWWQCFSGPFLYYPGRRLVPAPLRAFIDFIKASRE